MARWRAEAIERLPELRPVIAAADTVLSLWGELFTAFEEAYRREPPDESLIARIYAYADWCMEAPRGPADGRDPLSAAVVGFYEDIPTCRAARDDMPRWFRYSEVAENKQVFGYMLSDPEYEELVAFMRRNQHRYQPRASPCKTAQVARPPEPGG